MRTFLVFSAPFVILAATIVACSSSDSAGAASYGAGSDAGAGSSFASDASAPPGASAETYGKLVENDWIETAKEPVSTFGADVDTGSYSLMRRDVSRNILPNQDGIRVEEFINYFHYDYAPPQDDKPFAVHVDGAPSVFGEGKHLLRIGLQTSAVDPAQRKPANLVFLVDVSGSMAAEDKLPLVKGMLKSLVGKLTPVDSLAIVTYAGSEQVVLPATKVVDKGAILAAINGLTTGGGTNGEGGIRKAYQIAEQVKLQQQVPSVNRVILCTDGDFNVGLTGSSLVALIEEKRAAGVTLSTFGFGTGNYNARDMEELADKGNGNYAYIDGVEEIDRIVQKRLVATLQVVAKDTKIQLELDPAFVQRYRLVGYENRVMNPQDFEDDTKDSGEIGAGHSVTAFYEVELTDAAKAGQLATSNLANVHLRWKQPDGDVSTEASIPFAASSLASSFDTAAVDLRFAAATVEFAEILRHSKHSDGARFDDVIGILAATTKADPDRQQLVELATKAKALWK